MNISVIKRLIVLIFILSCSYLNAQDWLPLQVGNQWQYLSDRQDQGLYPHESFNLTYSEVDYDTMISGNTYYDLYSLLRYDPASQKLFIWCDSIEHLHIDFTLPVDTMVSLFTPDCNNYFESQIISENSFFNDSSIYSKGIEWYQPGFQELYEYWYFARGLGILNKTEDGQQNGGIVWETNYKMIQANINGVNYSENYYPGIDVAPDTTVSDSVFSLTFPVHHQYNHVYPDTVYYTNLNFIDTVKLFGFYKNGNTIINNPVVYAFNISSTSEDWKINTLLNMDLMTNGYTFNYRIEAIDKGLVPHISFSPDTGYYSARYDTATDVKDNPISIGEFVLYPNYPNPFNPVTEIKYSVGSPGKVSITVYDVLGNEIAVLVNEEKSTGTYIVNFNGSHLSSGVYFYRMKAGSLIQTRKMILLR